eukprot:TRINITY_DN3968_c0_g1_i1.p1 TRINITY_DN3968_c0_g1~~TRINITY_DN3968_c0_g1_i1.p1  ORF type:complete len:1125 (+),score=299.33 TRINITY_DN3968_c0_g1_i1:64-3375(+)
MTAENKQTRKRAENIFAQTVKSSRQQIVQALLTVARSFPEQTLRSFAVEMLRQSITGSDSGDDEDTVFYCQRFEPAFLTLMKEQILRGIGEDEESVVRSGFIHCVAELSADMSESTPPMEWPEIMNYIMHLAKSQVVHNRVSALNLLAQTAPFLRPLLVQGENFGAVMKLLGDGFNDSNILCGLASLLAMVSCVNVFSGADDAKFRNALRQFLPSLITAVTRALKEDETLEAIAALKLLIEIIEYDVGFILPQAPAIVNGILEIAHNSEFESSTRQLCVEFLTQLAEASPIHAKQIPNFAKNSVSLFLRMMSEIEDVPLDQWNDKMAPGETAEASLDVFNDSVAMEALDRLSISLGGEIIVPIIFEHVPGLLKDTSSWKPRHLALMAMVQVFEGCKEELFEHLDKIVEMVLPCFQDQNPRVRHAAVHVFGQLAIDFAPIVQEEFHAVIFNALVPVLDDTANPKCQAHSCAAILNMCDSIEPDTMKQYVEALLQKLYPLVQRQFKVLQEQAVQAISAVVACSGVLIGPYYPAILSLMMEIVQKVTSQQLQLLRGKAIECVGLLAVSVPDLFMRDSQKIVEALHVVDQQVQADSANVLRSNLIDTWTRVASVMKESFMPYLNVVMPNILKAASDESSVEKQKLENDAIQEELEGWDYVHVPSRNVRIAIHTDALEEKKDAITMLYIFASNMKAAYYPYVIPTLKILVPNFDNPYHDGIQLASLSAFPHVLNAAKLHQAKTNEDVNLRGIFEGSFPALLQSIEDQQYDEQLVVCFETVHQVLAVLGPGILSSQQTKDLMVAINMWLIACQAREQKLSEKTVDGMVDDSIITRGFLEMNAKVYVELSEILGVLIRNHSDLFLTHFDAISKTVMNMGADHCSDAQKHFLLCMFVDLFDHSSKAEAFYNQAMPMMLNFPNVKHKPFRQVAAFGLGVVAEKGPKQFDSQIGAAVNALVSVVNAKDSQIGFKGRITDNALSSLAKIMIYRTHVVEAEIPKMMDSWVNWLPCTHDPVESKVCHKMLVAFISTHKEYVFGPEYKNLPHILRIFARVLNTNLVEKGTQEKIKEILVSMQSSFPGDMMNAAFGLLKPEEKDKLRSGATPVNSPSK